MINIDKGLLELLDVLDLSGFIDGIEFSSYIVYTTYPNGDKTLDAITPWYDLAERVAINQIMDDYDGLAVTAIVNSHTKEIYKTYKH